VRFTPTIAPARAADTVARRVSLQPMLFLVIRSGFFLLLKETPYGPGFSAQELVRPFE